MSSSEVYTPDFVERNGAWLLTVFGLLLACVASVFSYALKSRCRKIKCCGVEIERDVLDLRNTPPESTDIKFAKPM